MTAPPPPSSPETDLARIALRRAREDARRYRFTKATESARHRTRRGRTRSVPLGQVLLEMLTERGLCHPVGASVLAQWPSVVGPDVAQHVIPVGFDEHTGTLTLHGASSAWLTSSGSWKTRCCSASTQNSVPAAYASSALPKGTSRACHGLQLRRRVNALSYRGCIRRCPILISRRPDGTKLNACRVSRPTRRRPDAGCMSVLGAFSGPTCS
ncbi:DUF721 domain-containing protein [Streptomyces rishiriensis]|uniref:DUF721 domain-containing protein n=1 Tax=Streptomyces rishiriensis TaxID=68264 RepID=UPI0035902A14